MIRSLVVVILAHTVENGIIGLKANFIRRQTVYLKKLFCSLNFFAVFLWTHSKEEVRSSMKHPGTYDQPKEAVTWLKNFKSLNSEHLSQVHVHVL
jgi:hypothetical protein